MKRNNAVSRAVPFAVTGLLLIVCLMLPLLFRGGESQGEPSPAPAISAGERAALYYAYATEDEPELVRLDGGEVDNSALIECTRIVNTVMNLLVMDGGSLRTEGPSGTNFYTLSDGDKSIRIMEYYREWTGDWHNWFTVHIDLDTREIYYLYYSANVQQNGDDYAGRAQEHLATAGQDIIRALGFDEEASLGQAGENNAWELELADLSGEVYNYSVICNIYEDAAPSLLIDLRLTLTAVS